MSNKLTTNSDLTNGMCWDFCQVSKPKTTLLQLRGNEKKIQVFKYQKQNPYVYLERICPVFLALTLRRSQGQNSNQNKGQTWVPGR